MFNSLSTTETWIRLGGHVFRMSQVIHFYLVAEDQLRINLKHNDFILIVSKEAKVHFEFLTKEIFGEK